MKTKNQAGYILLITLIFIQIFSLLGIAILETVIVHEKINAQQDSRGAL